jgi:hypothetical protein
MLSVMVNPRQASTQSTQPVAIRYVRVKWRTRQIVPVAKHRYIKVCRGNEA